MCESPLQTVFTWAYCFTTALVCSLVWESVADCIHMGLLFYSFGLLPIAWESVADCNHMGLLFCSFDAFCGALPDIRSTGMFFWGSCIPIAYAYCYFCTQYLTSEYLSWTSGCKSHQQPAMGMCLLKGSVYYPWMAAFLRCLSGGQSRKTFLSLNLSNLSFPLGKRWKRLEMSRALMMTWTGGCAIENNLEVLVPCVRVRCGLYHVGLLFCSFVFRVRCRLYPHRLTVLLFWFSPLCESLLRTVSTCGVNL